MFFQTDYVTITWDSEIEAVFSVWQGYTGGGLGKVQTGYQKIIELLIEKKSHRWVSDIRKLKVVDPADQVWIATTAHEELVKAGLTVLAVVMPENILAQVSIKQISNRLGEEAIPQAFFSELE